MNIHVHIYIESYEYECYVIVSFPPWSLRSWGLYNWTMYHIKNIESTPYQKYGSIPEATQKCELINEIQIKKLDYLGHIITGENYQLLRKIIQGKIKGKICLGWWKMSMHSTWMFGGNSNESFRWATSKVMVVIMISDRSAMWRRKRRQRRTSNSTEKPFFSTLSTWDLSKTFF